MKRRSWRTPVAITCAAALALGLAACGDDDDSSSETTAGAATTVAGVAPTTEAESTDTTEAESTDTTEAESTDTTEAEATDTSAAAGGGEFGLIDGVYTGGDGFVLDPGGLPRGLGSDAGHHRRLDHVLLEHAQGWPAGRVRV